MSPRARRTPSASAPVIAGVVIQTAPAAARWVATRLAAVPGLQIHGDDGDSRIAAVWSGEDGATLEELGEALIAGDEQVLGVFPTFAASLPPTSATPAVATAQEPPQRSTRR